MMRLVPPNTPRLNRIALGLEVALDAADGGLDSGIEDARPALRLGAQLLRQALRFRSLRPLLIRQRRRCLQWGMRYRLVVHTVHVTRYRHFHDSGHPQEDARKATPEPQPQSAGGPFPRRALPPPRPHGPPQQHQREPACWLTAQWSQSRLQEGRGCNLHQSLWLKFYVRVAIWWVLHALQWQGVVSSPISRTCACCVAARSVSSSACAAASRAADASSSTRPSTAFA